MKRASTKKAKLPNKANLGVKGFGIRRLAGFVEGRG
jgi:hypothetical protein